MNDCELSKAEKKQLYEYLSMPEGELLGKVFAIERERVRTFLEDTKDRDEMLKFQGEARRLKHLLRIKDELRASI